MGSGEIGDGELVRSFQTNCRLKVLYCALILVFNRKFSHKMYYSKYALCFIDPIAATALVCNLFI